MTTALLEAVDVTYSRGGRTVLAGVSVTLQAGDTLAVLGPSGSGKSSLLSLLAGLEEPDSGIVRLDGQPLRVGNIAQRRRIGLVLQGYGLLSLLTAAENVEVALQARGIAGRSARGRATDLLTSLQVSDVAGKLLEKLSGGQQQRVAIARALVAEPDVVLADEPTAELDHEMQDVVISHLLAAASAGSGVVIATHDADVARRCQRQLRLRNGQLHDD